MPSYNHTPSRQVNAYAYTQPGRSTAQLPHLNTNFDNSSDDSLHLPIQYPSPVKAQQLPNLTQQIRRKPVAARSESGTLGSFDPYNHLKSSRDDLLRKKLVPGIFSPDTTASNAAQEKIYGIKMRIETDRSISPDSPYQMPADTSWLQQSMTDPQGRLRHVRSEVKLKRNNHAAKEPKQRLQQRQKQDAQGQYAVLANIRQERSQLGRTKRMLNSNDEHVYPLLVECEKEDSVADMFERESAARLRGERRRLPPQKLRKPQALVEGRTGFVEKANKYEKQGMVQEDFSGWYGGSRKRDRAWKKTKILIAKMLRPKKNRWQHW